MPEHLKTLASLEDEHGLSRKAQVVLAGQIETLARVASSFSQTLDIDLALANGIEQVMEILGVEAASIFLYNERRDGLVCKASCGPIDINGLEVSASHGIVGRAAEADEPILIRDVYESEDFSPDVDDLTGFRSRSIMAAPLNVGDQRMGAIEVINRKPNGRQGNGAAFFSEADRSVLRLVASAAALAIHSAALASKALQQERLQREVELAAVVQRSLLPKDADDAVGIVGRNWPARETSGDFFDYFPIDERYWGFNIADVSGKGLNAALLGAQASSLLRSHGRLERHPGRLLKRINRELCESSVQGMFVTAIAGVFDTVRQVIRLTNAGNPPALLQIGEGIREFSADGPPLGIVEDIDYPEREFDLGGGMLLMFSDGLSESQDEAGDELGVEGVRALLEGLGPRRGLGAVEALAASVRKEGEAQADDITILTIGAPCEAFASIEQHFDADVACITLEARADLLTEVRQFVPRACRHLLQQAGEGVAVGEALLDDLVLAIDEACMNVVQHAYHGQAGHGMSLCIRYHAGALIFQLGDEAIRVDEGCMQSRCLNEIRPGGLGVHFIRSIMDEVRLLDFEACERLACEGHSTVPGEQLGPDQGNILQMVKYLRES